MAGMSTTLHFSLTVAQAEAVIALVNGLDHVWTPPARHPLNTAATALDEQIANQQREWEKCPTCKGSGWVEDAE